MEGLKLVYTSSQPILELAKFGKNVSNNSQQLLYLSFFLNQTRFFKNYFKKSI
jgi:hypothetical protein